MKPYLTYDPDEDILGIWLREAKPARSVDYADGITAVFDADGELLYMEIFDAKQRIDNTDLFIDAPEYAETATTD